LNLRITSLENTPIDQIVTCLVDSFSEYEVPLPLSVDYWIKRFAWARVDYSMSFGAFDDDRLIGFIIIGVDEFYGYKTAFNTGTGVLKPYRGHRIVDRLYEKAYPFLRENDVKQCALEVLTNNARATRVYERIGFTINRKLLCFKKELQHENDNRELLVDNNEMLLETIKSFNYTDYNSWDNQLSAIIQNRNGVIAKGWKNDKTEILSYVVAQLDTKYIHQIEMHDQSDKYEDIMAFIGQLPSGLWKINNIDERRIELIDELKAHSWDNYIDQYEMIMML